MPLGIFETCRRIGITVRAIRHYESLGLLLPRRINGARVYDATEFRTLELLQRFKAMGLSLAECRRGLKWFGQPTSGHWIDERTDLSAFVRSLQQRLDTIDSMLAELHIIRDEAVAARAAGRTA